MYRTEEELAKEAENPWTVGQLLNIDMDGHAHHVEGAKSWGGMLTSFRKFLERHRDIIVPGVKCLGRHGCMHERYAEG